MCPDCKVPMRGVYVTLDVGGFKLLTGFVGCRVCCKVRKVMYEEVEEIVKYRVVSVRNENDSIGKPDEKE